jgi:predicted permease
MNNRARANALGSLRPPRLASVLTALVVDPSLRAAVLADLLAIYGARRARDGRLAATRWYWAQTMRTIVAWLRGGTRSEPPHRSEGPVRRTAALDRWTQDIRFGCRLMARRPAVTAIAALTIAVGVGANLTVFTIINGTMLSPPRHVQRPEELVTVWQSYEGQPMLIPWPRFAAYDERNEVFSGMAAYGRLPLHLRASGERSRVQGALVSGGYFDLVGLTAHRGRLLERTDDRVPGAHPAVVISHSLWTRWGRPDAVVGTRVSINGHDFDVVGVAPVRFRGIDVGDDTEVWLPAAMQQVAMASETDLLSHPLSAWSSTFARLRDGVSLDVAQERMSHLAASLQAEREVFGGGEVLLFERFWISPYLRDDLMELHRMLAAVVGLVLVLACANVANLLLAEGLNRRGEIAMRRALGATRGRVLLQLVVEGVLLSGCGSIAGLILAGIAARWIAATRLSANLPLENVNLSIDHRVLLTTLVLTLVSGTAFALLPALHVTSRRLPLRPAAAAAGEGCGRGRLRSALVGGQVALSFALLVGAGMLVRTLVQLQGVDPGFAVDELATFAVDFELEGYDEPRGRQLAGELLRRLALIPGTEATAGSNLVPFRPAGAQRSRGVSVVFLEGDRVPAAVGDNAGPDGRILVAAGSVTGDYFRTMGTPLVAGRRFTAADDRTAAPVAMVSAKLAGDFWPGESAVGRSLRVDSKDSEPVEIVGVVADQNLSSLENRQRLLFRPFQQVYTPDMTIVLRSSRAPAELLAAIRAAVADVDSGLVVYGLETMTARVQRSLAQPLLLARLTGLFGLLALALAAVGLYGSLARLVNERVPELGVRIVLGARRRDLLTMVLRHGLGLIALGLLVGLPISWMLVRLFDTTIHGVARVDPTAIAVAAVVMAVSGGLACALPALRAARIDPVDSLRRL